MPIHNVLPATNWLSISVTDLIPLKQDLTIFLFCAIYERTETHEQLITLFCHAQLSCLFEIGHVLNFVLRTANRNHQNCPLPQPTRTKTTVQTLKYLRSRRVYMQFKFLVSSLSFVFTESLNCNIVMAVPAHSVTLSLSHMQTYKGGMKLYLILLTTSNNASVLDIKNLLFSSTALVFHTICTR